MVHLRIVAPAPVAAAALERLRATAAVSSIVHLPGAASRPAGDLILCDVAPEEASVVVSDLRGLGIPARGSIAIDTNVVVESAAADRAEREAPGSPADAVVWESVEKATSESAELSASFLAFMVIATAIAAVAILTDSQILLIGAMIVGPEFGPLAGISVGLVSRRPAAALRSLRALVVGFPAAIAATYLGTLAARAAGEGPDALGGAAHSATLFISRPNGWSALLAGLAGVAGTISLTTAKSGALIGVLVSVTTIPAAADVAVAGAYRDGAEAAGAAQQLAINLGVLFAAGAATLALQRWLFARRRERHRARPRPRRAPGPRSRR